MNLKPQTCCFTGSRQIPPGLAPILKEKTEKIILGLLPSGVRFFGVGGALGYDTIAAECVLDLRAVFPQIRLILILPCLDQSKNWGAENVRRYNLIKSKADKVVYTSGPYTRSCMFRRNRHLVDNSSICVAYCPHATGGTAYTVGYAKKRGLPVIFL